MPVNYEVLKIPKLMFDRIRTRFRTNLIGVEIVYLGNIIKQIK